ncbi:MAG: histidine phosphatase family protein [Alphaproteobacteria bacterium]
MKPGRRRLFLMRHGEVRYFDSDGRPVHPRDVPLTENGEADAKAIGELLADTAFDAALHTGVPRTMRTLDLVLAGRHLPTEEARDFREVTAGRLTGRTIDDVQSLFEDSMRQAHLPGARHAEGEVFAEFYARVTGAVQTLLTKDWTTLLLVAHEGTNRMLLGWASGAGLAAVGGFEQDPACLNIIDIDMHGPAPRPFIKAMNLTPRNPHKAGNHMTSMEQVFAARARPGKEN